MGKLRRSVCRLCLEKCVDFKVVEDYVQEVLNILLLKINLAVSKEPVMCTNCEAMLMKCFDFKATCFYTHDYIVPFLDDEKISKLDLRKVYMSKHENVDIPRDHGTCSICMGLAKKCTAISLDDEEGDVVLEKLIEKHLPELDLSTIEEAIICTPCHESLKNYSHFVMSCLTVEEKVMEYSKLKGADVIDIADVLQLTSRKVSRVADNTSDFASTERKFCVDMRNADEQVGQENNSFVQMEEQKVLRNEDVEIKTDQHDFDRFLDGVVVVSPQPITKLCGKEKGLMAKGGPLKNSNKHKKARRVSKARMHQCDFCSYQTKYRANLQRHMLIHKKSSETTMYQCDSCSFKTKHKNTLGTHMLKHKDPSEVKMYRCDSCPFRTKYGNSLRRHEITHKHNSEATMYQCDSCSFKTKHKHALCTHMLIHKDPSEVKIYRCGSCRFRTKYGSSLRTHEIINCQNSKATID